MRDQWLPFRFRGAGLTMVLSISVIVLKTTKAAQATVTDCTIVQEIYCSPLGRVLMEDLAMWLALFNTIGVEWHLSLLDRTLGASVQSTIPFSLPLRLWAHVKVKPPPAWVSGTLQRAEHPLNMKYIGENNSLLLKLRKVWDYLLLQHNLPCLTNTSPTRIYGQKTLLHQLFNLRTWCAFFVVLCLWWLH